MRKKRLPSTLLSLLFLFMTSLECDERRQVTVDDFLRANSVEDLALKYPDLKKHSGYSDLAVLTGQKNILRAINDEDLPQLSKLFDKIVDIEIGNAYYKKFSINKAELEAFKKKKSTLYKFMFDHEAAKVAIADATALGIKWHSLKYHLQHGFLHTFVKSGNIYLALNEPQPHGIWIRTLCTPNNCLITGFAAGGY